MLFEYICIKMVGQQGSGLSVLPRLLARESTSRLREERRIEGEKSWPQAWKIGPPRL